MRADDFERFHDGIVGVMSFYGKDVSTFALDIWWNALSSYDLTAIMAAFNRYVTNPDCGQFAPKPADIIRMLEGTTQDSAVMAWAKVQQAVGSVGAYQSLAFDDPIIHLAISDLGGWIEICRTLEAELPFLAKRFETSYRAYKRRGSDIPAHPRYLVGISETTNNVGGFRSDPPRLVGDPAKAQAVLSGGTDSGRVQITSAGSAIESIRLVHKRDAA